MWKSFALKGLVLVAIVAAMWGPSVPVGGEGARVVVIDRSGSFAARRKAAEARLRLLDAAPLTQTVLVRGRVEMGAENDRGLAAAPGSALPEGLAAARKEVERAGGGDVVLLSDGLGDPSDVLGAANVAAQRGVPIHVLCPPSPKVCLVSLADVRGPGTVSPGEGVNLVASLLWNGLDARGDAPSRGLEVAVRVSSVSGRELLRLPVSLDRAGSTAVTLVLPPALVAEAAAASDPGAAPPRRFAVTVALEPVSGDPIRDDDEAQVVAWLRGEDMRVLWVVRSGGSRALADAVAGLGVPVTLRSSEELGDPANGAAASWVLEDVPAAALHKSASGAVARFVESGGGLVVVGADHAFGPGGYDEDPLSKLLPVDPTPATEAQRPLALFLLIDRSGSMAGPAAPGVSKVSAAWRSAAAVSAKLSPMDRLGLISFAESTTVLAELRSPSSELFAGAAPEPNGGTDVFPAIEQALATLREYRAEPPAPETLLRIVLVSDGRSEQTEDPEGRLVGLKIALEAARSAGAPVTLSVIAVGRDVDAVLLGQLAAAGGGRLITVDAGPAALVEALLREADPRPRALLREGPVSIVAGQDAAALGIQPEDHAGGVGAVAETSPRAHAQVALATTDGLPAFAVGEAGAGQVAALPVRADPSLAEWIVAALRRVERRGGPGATLRTERDALGRSRWVADVDSVDRDPEAWREPGVRVRAFAGSPGAVGVTFGLTEERPGRFVSEWHAPAFRPRLGELLDARGSVRARSMARAAQVEPSAALPDQPLLDAIVARTGGLRLEDRVDPLPRARAAGAGSVPLRPWLCALALILALLDLRLGSGRRRG
ncbi:MAG: VWA domain-containing protein [Planctomycetota bacterium]|jgi:Mg-chelatase subunit ChlD